MARSRNSEKSWATAYQSEQRQPHGVTGGGQWTRGSINPATAAAQRNQAAIARHEALVHGQPMTRRPGTGGGGGTGPDAEDQGEAARARQLQSQAAQIEQQIDHLRSDLKNINAELKWRAANPPGAASGKPQSATAAAAAAAKPGAAAGASTGGSSSSPFAGVSTASLQSRKADIRGDIKRLKSQRAKLLREARTLLRDSQKTSRPSITKGNRVATIAPEATKAVTSGEGAEMVHLSFPIEKAQDTAEVNPVDGTPDLEIWGKATDGTLDSDLQIVDPDWSLKALQDWFSTKANIRMQHDPKRPVGKGIEVDGHYVRARISDPLAKHFIRKNVLNDFSVGITNPDIRVRDPKFRHLPDWDKASGGVITGRTDGLSGFGEISVVDRGSNYGTKFSLIKAAKDGTPEWAEEMTAPEEVLAKVGTPTLLKVRKPPKAVNVDLPANMSLSIKPSDLAKLQTFGRQLAMQEAAHKTAAASLAKAATVAVDGEPVATVPLAGKRDFDPDVGGGVDRDKIPGKDFAGRNRSFPIVTQADVSDAFHSLGRAGADNYPPEKIRRNIIRIARRKGFTLPASVEAESKKPKKASKAAEPDMTKCGPCGGSGMVDGKPCTSCKKGRKMARRVKKASQDGTIVKALRLLDEFAATLSEPSVTKKRKVMCGSCGARQNRKHDHCSECGKPLEGAIPVMKNHAYTCLGCGKDLDKGEKFCPGCGKENPGYLPEADHQIPANRDAEKAAKPKKGKKKAGKKNPFGGNQAPPFGAKDGDSDDDSSASKAGKGRVTKGKKKGGKPTPASAGGAVGEHGEMPAGHHREPDGAEVEAFEADAHLEDGDSEKPTHLEEHTLKARKKKGRKPKGAPGGDMPPEDKGSEMEKSAMLAPSDDPQLGAALRLKALDVPVHLGIAHDLTCPAFLPAEVDLCYPGVSLKTLDFAAWQDDALEKAAGASMEEAQRAGEILQAAVTLRMADPRDIADLREGAYKMFTGANPGPSHFPTPTQISPERFQRPLITAGHEAPSPGHKPPRDVRLPEMGGIQPEDYRRGYISSGHADDSPGNTHPEPPMPAPDRTGVPSTESSRVFYRNSAREGDEHAMRVLHDHIAARFPALCPMHPHFASTPVPTPAGVPGVAAAPGAKKSRRKDKAAKAKARKQRRMERKLLKNAPPPPVAAVMDEAALEAALSKATAPLLERIAGQDQALKAQQKVLRKQAKALDAIAGQPDTSQAPFRGVALTKTAASPAGLPFTAKSAEQIQADTYARLYGEWATTTDPAAQAALARVLAPYWNPAMNQRPPQT